MNPYKINVPGNVEEIAFDFYDTESGNYDFHFFQRPLGTFGKRIVETNFIRQGQMPAEQCFLIQTIDIAIRFPERVFASSFELTIGGKIMFVCDGKNAQHRPIVPLLLASEQPFSANLFCDSEKTNEARLTLSGRLFRPRQ